MFLFKTGKAVSHKLIFDIGSSEVSLALVETDAKNIPRIKRFFKSENIILPETDLRRLWKKVSLLVKKVADDFKSTGIKAEEALVIFSSPWYFSEIRRFSKKLDSPLTITKDYTAEVIRAEEAGFRRDASSAFGIPEDDLGSSIAMFMSAKLNGYPIKNPSENIFGKSAKEILFSIYISSFYNDAALFLRDVMQECGIKRSEFQSSPWILFNFLFKKGINDVSILNISGEITDVVLIREGEISKIVSYGRGLNYIIRRVASAMNIGLEEAESMLLGYREGMLEAGLGESLGGALKEAMKEWHNLFRETVENHILPELMPEKILLTGHASQMAEFKEILDDGSEIGYTDLGRAFLFPVRVANLDLTDLYLYASK